MNTATEKAVKRLASLTAAFTLREPDDPLLYQLNSHLQAYFKFDFKDAAILGRELDYLLGLGAPEEAVQVLDDVLRDKVEEMLAEELLHYKFFSTKVTRQLNSSRSATAEVRVDVRGAYR